MDTSSKMVPAETESIKLLTLPYKYKNWSESIYSLHLSDFKKSFTQKIGNLTAQEDWFQFPKGNKLVSWLPLSESERSSLWKGWIKREKCWHRSGHLELIWISTAATWSTYDLDGRVSAAETRVIENADMAQNLQTRLWRLKGKSGRDLWNQ